MTTAELVAAFHELGEESLNFHVEDSVSWLIGAQLMDGSWSDPNSDDPWDVSSTSWALWALKNANPEKAKISEQKGLRWLSRMCDSSGGLPTNSTNRTPNTYATSYAHRAFSYYGEKDLAASTFRFLSSLQNSDGGWGLRESEQSDPTLTCYVLHGLIDGRLDSAEPVIRSGFEYLDYIRSPNGTWNSWLEDHESVEGTAFGIYVRLKFGLPIARNDFLGLRFLVGKIRNSNAWEIDGVDQLWVAVSVLLAAHYLKSCMLGDDEFRGA